MKIIEKQATDFVKQMIQQRGSLHPNDARDCVYHGFKLATEMLKRPIKVTNSVTGESDEEVNKFLHHYGTYWAALFEGATVMPVQPPT